MTPSSLYPGFVKFFYTTNAHQHVQTIPCRPFEGVGGDWYLEYPFSVTGILWTDAVYAYMNKFKAMIHTTASVVSAELWSIASIGADPVWEGVYPLAVAGTNGTVAGQYSQAVITYRTDLGGLYRWYLMEGSNAEDVITTPPFGAGVVKDMNDYLLSTSSWIVGRDGGLLVAPIRYITKENDALRKKYFLNL